VAIIEGRCSGCSSDSRCKPATQAWSSRLGLRLGLDDLAIEWWGKAGDEALRRSAFQEAISHLGKAIEMADKAGATPQQATGGSTALNQRLTQLHVAQANALTPVRGYGAAETTEAFAKARESASGDEDALGRLEAD
jgi:predicted ATPase